jgi:DNA helicase-2/ATP-dependent DNA helicase PcrA
VKNVSIPSLDHLNEAQRRAATHVEGPLLVLAGPGSGKTRVVTHRVAHLIASGIPPSRIVALTFTNKAADEMRRRVTALVGPQPVEMGTFHRFAARLLRRHARMVGLTADYSILDPDDASSLLRRAAKLADVPLARTPVDRVAGVISRAKNDLVTPEAFEPRWGRPVDEVAKRVWPVYQELLLRADSVDFDDLLVHVARLLLEQPELRAALDQRYRFILVDEYQDTNAVQYCILRGLSIDHPHLAVTGDPDQAIYGWRGASIRNILEFERDYPAATVVKLERNYRSTANILGTADRLIACNARRKPKRLVTDADPGPPVRIVLDASGHEEADRIADEIAAAITGGRRAARDVAILFRTNALSRSLEVALRTRGIPYQLVRGLEFFRRREVRDLVAWLRLVRNPRDDEAVLRVVNMPPRGIGKRSLEHLTAWAEEHRTGLLEAAGRADEVPGVSSRAARALTEFARLHAGLADTASRDRRVAILVEAILERTGYRRMLEEEAEDDEADRDRLANAEELLTAARQYDDDVTAAAVAADRDPAGSAGEADWDDPLGGFLEMTALVSDADAWDPSGDRVALMTLHAAKGLEFPVVYLVALEDGIVPHERSLERPEQLEEERRLVFVGLTRGRDEVCCSCARMRDYRGTRRIAAPSLFLAEMTGSETVVTGSEAPADDWAPTGRWSDSGGADEDAPGVDEPSSPAFTAARDDGLVLEMEEPPEDLSPRRRRRERDDDDAASRQRAEALAMWAAGSPGGNSPTFAPGQRVRHAEHGEGTLTAISGVGARSIGTVAFDGSAGTRKYILGYGAIVPAD